MERPEQVAGAALRGTVLLQLGWELPGRVEELAAKLVSSACCCCHAAVMLLGQSLGPPALQQDPLPPQ